MRASSTSNFDVVVYGGTPSGIIAACEAAQAGKSVCLIEPSQHVGGMMTSGLTASDYHNPNTVGGKALSFYYRVGSLYQSLVHAKLNKSLAKRDQLISKITYPVWDYESHIGEQVFNQMLLESGVTCILGKRIDRVGSRGITKVFNHITSITMETGEIYQGSVFIDSSYEGDLMALAHVPYVVGRESSSTYNESLNGVQPQTQYRGIVDPYVIPGNPSSGLLPGVDSQVPGNVGDADNRVQAYNFRLCMTNNPDNRVAAPKPENYNPLDYELLSRLIAQNPNSVFGAQIAKFAPLPNGKVDVNSSDAFSTDLISPLTKTWADASYDERDKILQRYRDYTQGFLWFVTNDPRVPLNIRAQAAEWGLAADEFMDNGNMPYRIYVREARRMLGEHIMTGANAQGTAFVYDPIALGCYGMDSHQVTMYVDKEGLLNIEGGLWSDSINYGISYRSLVPKLADCDNLIVSICISASHVAYGSIRMEPVYMEMGQAAGAAASLAIDNATSVQSVNYSTLAAILVNEGQVISDPNWSIGVDSY
jgi:hypothetical protein